MAPVNPLLTLRTQLEAASQKWPSVRHRIAFHVNKLVQSPNELRPPGEDQNEMLSENVGVLVPSRFIHALEVPTILWSCRLSSSNRLAAAGASERFRDLAATLWTVVSRNWPEIIASVECPYSENTNAGIASRVWLGDSWKFFEREKALEQRERLRTQVPAINVDDIWVPEVDEWRLDGMSSGSADQMWALLIHNLAWLRGSRCPLQSECVTWNAQGVFPFREISDLTRLMEMPFPASFNIQLPLECFASTIQGDVFLASIWAIDEIVGMIAATDGSQGCVLPVDWRSLDSENFERLVFSIFKNAPDYKNPQWLTETQAPDSARDLSVSKIVSDSLDNTREVRIIAQCKHWTSKSVNPDDVHAILIRIPIWEPPPVQEVIIVTSGRFTDAAVKVIETHNYNGKRPLIHMWANTELERIISLYPDLRKLFE